MTTAAAAVITFFTKIRQIMKKVMEDTPRILRPRSSLYVILAVAKMLFVAGLVFTYARSGWTFTSVGFAVMTLVAALGFVEIGTTRLIIADDYLDVGPIWKRRRYQRADIKRVTWEKGAGVVLELNRGGWAKLPELGFNSQGLTNTIRAWLKRT